MLIDSVSVCCLRRRKEGGQGLTGMQSKQGFRQNICDLSVNNDIDQPLLLAHTSKSVLTVQDCDQSWLPFSIYDLFQLSGSCRLRPVLATILYI